MVKHTWVLLAVLLVACGGGDGAGVIDIDSGQDALQDAGQSDWQDAGQDVSRETSVSCTLFPTGDPNYPDYCFMPPGQDGGCNPGYTLRGIGRILPDASPVPGCVNELNNNVCCMKNL